MGRGQGGGALSLSNVKISIVSKMGVLLTNPYVKKCFSREFVSEVPLFCAQSRAEITNRKLVVLLEMDILTFIHDVVRWLNRYIMGGCDFT
ncbi:hypothetical protein M2137_001545 [Parabacteroides sp. PFB2-10]|nr:hypothetical protein [Parabacteroides sp. PFB2-10]